MSTTTATTAAHAPTAGTAGSGAGRALMIGLAGLLLTVIGFFVSGSHAVALSYLVGLSYCTAIAIGMLLLVLIHHIFDASWSVVLRRQYEHAFAAFPWLFVLFLPLLVVEVIALALAVGLQDPLPRVEGPQIGAGLLAGPPVFGGAGLVFFRLGGGLLGGPGFVADWVTATGITAADYSIAAQVWTQAKAVLVTVVWSGVVSFVAFKLVDLTVGLRVSEEAEREGLDISSHGETAYHG